MIEFKNVSKTYTTGTEAVNNANFKIEKGEFVFLVGSSGSRKININKANFKTDLEINLIDERLSTVEATNYLIGEDMSRKGRKKIVDAVAASIILDTYLRKVQIEKERNEQ